LIEKIKTTVARIEVQPCFCNVCCGFIKREIQEIDEVNNVRFYPKESLITFNFTNAHKLSTVLNILSENGYYERGEQVVNAKLHSACVC